MSFAQAVVDRYNLTDEDFSKPLDFFTCADEFYATWSIETLLAEKNRTLAILAAKAISRGRTEVTLPESYLE